MNKILSSEYILNQRKEYAIYVLEQRALPSISDGLIVAGRRLLWTAKNGEKYKTATLAGATMPLHPHAAPDGVINTLTSPYGNNVSLFSGYGAFGTKVDPINYGSSRYTSVKISKFTKDVIFKDIEIIPMKDNYDQTLKEPLHFLPLVPICLVNPSSGVGVGFASDILPRDLNDIIKDQISIINGKSIKERDIYFKPYEQYSINKSKLDTGMFKWDFKVGFERLNSFEIRITELPYGMIFKNFIKHLTKLEEDIESPIKDFIDNSSDTFDIIVKFERGYLNNNSDEKVIKLLKLSSSLKENLTLLDFNGSKVRITNYIDIVSEFTVWRLKWYVDRYERLLRLLQIDIQKYRDIITAIDNNVGNKANSIKDKLELVEFLKSLNIVNLDYIANMPVYKFTIDEKEKVEKLLGEALELESSYNDILNDEEKRKMIYISELKEVLKNYKKGMYSNEV